MEALRQAIDLRWKSDRRLQDVGRKLTFGVQDADEMGRPWVDCVILDMAPLHTTDADIWEFRLAFAINGDDTRGITAGKIAAEVQRVFDSAEMHHADFHPAYMVPDGGTGPGLVAGGSYEATVRYVIRVHKRDLRPAVRHA